MADTRPPLPQIPIEQAPYEERRCWLLEERRNSRISVAVIVMTLGLLGWGAWRWLMR